MGEDEGNLRWRTRVLKFMTCNGLLGQKTRQTHHSTFYQCRPYLSRIRQFSSGPSSAASATAVTTLHWASSALLFLCRSCLVLEPRKLNYSVQYIRLYDR